MKNFQHRRVHFLSENGVEILVNQTFGRIICASIPSEQEYFTYCQEKEQLLLNEVVTFKYKLVIY